MISTNESAADCWFISDILRRAGCLYVYEDSSSLLPCSALDLTASTSSLTSEPSPSLSLVTREAELTLLSLTRNTGLWLQHVLSRAANWRAEDHDEDDGDDGEDGEEEEEEDTCQLSVCRDRLSLGGGWSRNYDQILRLAVDRTNSSLQMVSSQTGFKMSVFFSIISTKAWLPQDPAGEDLLGGLAVFSSEGELETFLRTFTAQDKARNVPVVEINSRITLA